MFDSLFSSLIIIIIIIILLNCFISILADRTNGRVYATLLRPSVCLFVVSLSITYVHRVRKKWPPKHVQITL